MTGRAPLGVASRVLLVDDNEALTKVIAEYLTDENREIVSIVDGDAGIAEIDRERFDLYILDVMLRNRSGFDLLRRIRAISDAPIILISAVRKFEETSFALGADAFFPKPLSLRMLTETVTQLLRRAPTIEARQMGTMERRVRYNLGVNKGGTRCW